MSSANAYAKVFRLVHRQLVRNSAPGAGSGSPGACGNEMTKTISSYREVRSLELALSGMSWDQVAEELGYANRSGPWKAAQRCLARHQIVAADRYRAVRLAELDMLQARYWRAAMAGSPKAAGVVLRVIEARIRLMNL